MPHLADVVPHVWRDGIVSQCQAVLEAGEADVVLPCVEAGQPQVGPHLSASLAHLLGAGRKVREAHMMQAASDEALPWRLQVELLSLFHNETTPTSRTSHTLHLQQAPVEADGHLWLVAVKVVCRQARNGLSTAGIKRQHLAVAA